MGDILVFAESQGSKIKKTAFEALSKAKELASQTSGQVLCAVIGNGVEGTANELASYGAQKVFVVEKPELDKYNTIDFVGALEKIANEAKPQIILAASSPLGKDLFPRLAARLEAGIATESTDLRIDGGKLIARHPVYSGKAFVDVEFTTDVQIATIRPNSFPTNEPEAGASAQTQAVDVELKNACPMQELVQGAQGKADLTEAEIIVSGGRAMANSDNFKILHELADVIGATVGASRAAVDSGFAPHDMQVGQTGKVVNPKLYIACGISGAIQHLAGMRTSKIIVAINKDPEAPLFTKADYGIVGDLFTIVPLLTEEFKKVMTE